MNEFHFLLQKLLLLSEVTAAVVGIIKFRKFKDTYWKWFIYYLVFIACSELVCKFVLRYYEDFMDQYLAFFVMPLEFLAMFWLYYKSLKNQKILWISASVFLLSLVPYFVLEGKSSVNAFNYTLGGFLMTIMILLEYRKQMKSDDILKFRENMMFYINIGVGFFYVGTLPFFAFNSQLWAEKPMFFNYYALFLMTNVLMYTLFSIALLWGKPNTY